MKNKILETYQAHYLIAKALLIQEEGKDRIYIKIIAHILAILTFITLPVSKLKDHILEKKYYKKELIEKYKGLALAEKSYASKSGNKYILEDFTDFNMLEHVLAEVNDHETSLTKKGVNFLEEYYGLNNLANELYKREWYSPEYKSTQEILDFLKYIKKRLKKYNY